MASKSLPWKRAVELVTELNEADASILKVIAANCPDLMSGADNSTRERVSLKYLEKFLDSHRENASHSIREIESCKALEEILYGNPRKEGTLLGLEMGASKWCGRDLEKFILSKRATLSKPSVDVVQEFILEACCLDLSSLKEYSFLSAQLQDSDMHYNNGDGDNQPRSPNSQNISGDLIEGKGTDHDQCGDDIQPTSPICQNIFVDLNNGRTDHEHGGLENSTRECLDTDKMRSQEEVIYISDDDPEVPTPIQQSDDQHGEPSERASHLHESTKNQGRKKPSQSRKTNYFHKRYSNPLNADKRRKRRKWTPEEENFLMDEVPRVKPNANGTIPWRVILENGSHVFEKTREPEDLRVKWRLIKGTTLKCEPNED